MHWLCNVAQRHAPLAADVPADDTSCIPCEATPQFAVLLKAVGTRVTVFRAAGRRPTGGDIPGASGGRSCCGHSQLCGVPVRYPPPHPEQKQPRLIGCRSEGLKRPSGFCREQV
jgi:hypothetical protein